ncbi:unnamed protein product, partial [Mesorhabditis spiculigera]
MPDATRRHIGEGRRMLKDSQ